ncbi:MAG: ferredoxin reductase [Sneathiella sp.]|nr:MAG: ferredoxin reductase [Sneathiella sp.]
MSVLTMTKRRIIIIGAGPAGVSASIAARRISPDNDVILLATETALPYEKPPLSKEVPTKGIDPSAYPIVPADMLAGIDLRTDSHAIAIDRAAQAVNLNDGKRLHYDTLVLTTGGTPRILAELPPSTPNVFYLRNAADARALRKSFDGIAGKQVAIIGAGLIGLEVVAAATLAGAEVTVFEAGATAIPRFGSEEMARRVTARHEQAGARFKWQTTVTEANFTDGAIEIHIDDGPSISVDLVVVGIGIWPNSELAKAAGLAVDGGILVDAQCRTSDPNIYAAGDVVKFRTSWSKAPVILENWRHALDQGEIAGINAGGGEAAYETVPSFWSDQYELKLQGIGWAEGSDGPVALRELGQGRMIEFHFGPKGLCYAVGIGAGRELAITKRLIERKVNVNLSSLADPEIALATLLRSG